MMQLLKKIFSNNTLIISIVTIIVFIIFLIYQNGLVFNNEIDIKDIISLLFNIVFIFFISITITKNYDINRKEKDVIINDIIEIKKNAKLGFEIIKNCNYSEKESNKIITSLREDLYHLKNLIESSIVEKASESTKIFFDQINTDIKSIDRLISPNSSANRLITVENEILLNDYSRRINKELSKLMLKLNSL